MLVKIGFSPEQVVAVERDHIVLRLSARHSSPYVVSVPGQTKDDFDANDALKGAYLHVGERGAITVHGY